MLVSHAHRFIFLHGQKTAGSAITLSLLRHLKDDDLWLNAPSRGIFADALKHGIVPPPATKPQVLNGLMREAGKEIVDKALERPKELTADERRAFASAFHATQDAPPPGPGVLGGWQHVSAEKAREYLSPDIWDNYYKFTFERDPWDRLISLYWWRWRTAETPGVTFPEFVNAVCEGGPQVRKKSRALAASNWPIYAIGDHVVVDKIAKYEKLRPELRSIHEKIGVPFDGWIPKLKSKSRKNKDELARTMDVAYNAELAMKVAKSFYREIAILGYTTSSPLLEAG